MGGDNEAQTARILKLLKIKGSATNAELNRICFRYSARLHELRKEGYVIVTDKLKGGLFRYTYKGRQADVETLDAGAQLSLV